MKKLCLIILAACLLMGLALPAPAGAAGSRIILYTAYRQMGWGDLIQIGWVDENGGLWGIQGHDSDLRWPYAWEDQIAYLESCPGERLGQLTGEALFDLKGLIESAENGESKPQGWMNDAGTETARAVRYTADGRAESVLLGMTGDDHCENRDPDAQALYRKLRELFPFVTCYAAMDPDWGFEAVPLRAFLGIGDVDLEGARVRIFYNDCEAGPAEIEPSEAEAAEALALIQNGFVTGKENASAVTGGTYTVVFEDGAGNTLCSFQMYKGLLTARDGMYALEIRTAAPTDGEALNVSIGGRDYTLGRSTAREFVDAGWHVEEISGGEFGFRGTEGGNWFYVATSDGTLDGAIVSVNLMWAYGIPYHWCGCGDGSGKDLWTWMKDSLGAGEDPDGLLTAYVPLSGGGIVRVETRDDRPALTLFR